MDEIISISEKFLTCHEVDELFAVFLSEINKHNYDNAVITTHSSIAPEILGAKLPNNWAEYYIDKEYWKIDPAYKRLEWDWQPHLWQDCIHDVEDKRVLNFMEEASENGLKHGITISNSYLGRKLNIGISSKENLDDFQVKKMFQFSQAIGAMFSSRLTLITQKNSDFDISPREKETLRWMIMGKKNQEIAELMGVEVNTINENIKRVKTKNNIKGSRMEVISRALLSGKVSL